MNLLPIVAAALLHAPSPALITDSLKPAERAIATAVDRRSADAIALRNAPRLRATG